MIFVLPQESGHGKYNGAVECELVTRLGMEMRLKDVLIACEPDLDMLTCGDNLLAHEL